MIKKRGISFIFFIMMISLITIGFSTWIDNTQFAESNLVTERDQNTQKVCYIKGETEETNRYFTTIEKALEVGSQNEVKDSIFVIPGTNPTITRTCTIDVLDALYLPYDGETCFEQVHTHYEKNGLGYLNEANRKNLITINENVVFNVLGKLYIGGIQSGGSGGAYYSGHTCSYYTEIHLKKNARLISFGEITAYGYISGTLENEVPVSKISLENGSLTYMPFVVREHRGGSVFLGMSGKDASALRSMIMKMLNAGTKVTATLSTSPFNRFLINNFYNIDFSFNYGSKLTGKASMFADGQFNSADVGLIGNSNNYFIKTNEKTLISGYFHKNKEKCYLNIFGSANITSLKLQLHVYKQKGPITVDGDVILSTSDILFPLSHYFDVTLNKYSDGREAIIDCQSQGFKVMPASNLTVNEGVSLLIKRLSIYSYADLYPEGKYIVTGNVGTSSPYEEKKDADGNYIESKVINNGNITVEQLGGIVYTNESSGILNITNNNSLISKEIVSTEVGNITILGQNLQSYMSPIYLDINKTAQGHLDSNDNLSDLSVRTYTSGGTYWESIEREYPIKYYKYVDDNEPYEIPVPSGNPTFMKSSQLVKLSSLQDEGSNRFVGYYVQNRDKKLSQIPLENKGSKLFSYLENGTLNVYIRYSTWNRAKVNFNGISGETLKSFTIIKGEIITEEEFSTSLISEFESVKINSSNVFYDLYYNYCVGWYLKGDENKNPINSYQIPDNISDMQIIEFEPIIENSIIGSVITVNDSSSKGSIELVEGNISYIFDGVTYYQKDSTFNITISNSVWPVGPYKVRLKFSDGTVGETYSGNRYAAGIGDQKVHTNISISKNATLEDV